MITLKAENIKLISSNQRLVQGKGRWYANPKYAESKTLLYWHVKKCLKDYPDFKMLKENIGIIINVKTYNDIDNCIKIILDCLQDLKVIENDRAVISLAVNKIQIKKGKPDSVEVKVYEL